MILIKEYDKSSPKNVPWVVFSPFPENTIEWTADFDLYAANVGKDDVVTILTSREAILGKSYPFQNNRFGEMEDGIAGKITLVNQVAKTLFFGLTQDLLINGESYVKKPISLVCVPYNQTAEFSPLEKVTIFLGSGYQDKRFMGIQVHSQMLSLDFKTGAHFHLTYDEKTGKFINS